MRSERASRPVVTHPRLGRYPRYTDSGIEWLGVVPAHWTTSKVKFLGRYVNGYAFKPDDWSVDGRPIVRIQNLTNPDATFNRFVGELDQRYRVRQGDILISWSASLGLSVWPHEEDGWLNQHIFKVELREGLVDRRFFVWLGTWFVHELKKETHGSTMTHLTYDVFGGFRVEVPPLEEQRLIATFLDRDTARIDALVAKKERLIELLQEQRTAFITQAVTKGLYANVPMKDSGVEWLCDVPAHWPQLAFGRVLRHIEQGWSPLAEDRQAGPDEWGVIKLNAVQKGSFHPHEHKALPRGVDPDRRYRIHPGDLLLTRANTPELVGDACVVKSTRGGLMLCDLVYRLSVDRRRASPAYLAYWIRSRAGRHQIEVDARGSSKSMVKISRGIIRSLTVLLPPLSEQHAITAHLDRETARIDALITKVRKAIDRLTELRSALISAAVTGKIDVREEVG